MKKFLYILTVFSSIAFSGINTTSCSCKKNDTDTRESLNNFYAEIYDSDKAYYEIYTELSNYYNIDYNDLINDDNLQLEIYMNDHGDNKLVEHDDILNYHLLCNVDVTTNDNDLYFKKTNVSDNCIVRKKIDINNFSLNDNQKGYDSIYLQISKQINNNLDSFFIKNDPLIEVKIYDSDSKLLEENFKCVLNSQYELKISILNKDFYFISSKEESKVLTAS